MLAIECLAIIGIVSVSFLTAARDATASSSPWISCFQWWQGVCGTSYSHRYDERQGTRGVSFPCYGSVDDAGDGRSLGDAGDLDRDGSK